MSVLTSPFVAGSSLPASSTSLREGGCSLIFPAKVRGCTWVAWAREHGLSRAPPEPGVRPGVGGCHVPLGLVKVGGHPCLWEVRS